VWQAVAKGKRRPHNTAPSLGVRSARAELHDRSVKVFVAKVDVTANPTIGDRERINAYPTIRACVACPIAGRAAPPHAVPSLPLRAQVSRKPASGLRWRTDTAGVAGVGGRARCERQGQAPHQQGDTWAQSCVHAVLRYSCLTLNVCTVLKSLGSSADSASVEAPKASTGAGSRLVIEMLPELVLVCGALAPPAVHR
jgi:hypothetical protein